jgi:hypothetical protein
MSNKIPLKDDHSPVELAQIIYVAYSIHCAGGSGGDPRFCLLADQAAEKLSLGNPWELEKKFSEIYNIKGAPN